MEEVLSSELRSPDKVVIRIPDHNLLFLNHSHFVGLILILRLVKWTVSAKLSDS